MCLVLFVILLQATPLKPVVVKTPVIVSAPVKTFTGGPKYSATVPIPAPKPPLDDDGPPPPPDDE